MNLTPERLNPDPPSGFVVHSPHYSGSLGDLGHALRSERLTPQQVDVLALVRMYLAYYRQVAEHDLALATETLPQLGRVIELKTRLLLPKPPKPEAEEAELCDTLETIALLEEFEDAISFLKGRREGRRHVLLAHTPCPDYPRRRRPLRVPVKRLRDLASRYRRTGYFELSVPRLTLGAAIKTLQDALRRLKRGVFGDLASTHEWGTLTVYFAAMLELIRENKLRASQESRYGPIVLEHHSHQSHQDAEREAA